MSILNRRSATDWRQTTRIGSLRQHGSQPPRANISSPITAIVAMSLLELSRLGVADDEWGVVVVDHGSRRDEANQMLLEVVDLFAEQSGCSIVEPAHMELLEPTVATAFDRCVERGAKLIVVMPYFLAPGRHWDEHIPELARAAVARHEGVRYLVTAPLGPHTLMAQLMQVRIEQCVSHVLGDTTACDYCRDTPKCRLAESE